MFVPYLLREATRIWFRADGNARIGLGHLTRCRVLAELLADAGWSCGLATREPPGASWFGYVLGSGYTRTFYSVPVLPIPADLPLADEPDWLNERLSPYDVLVLDGYAFDLAYQLRCQRSGRGLVVFDDFARAYTSADVVLNAAGGIGSARYAGLAGPGARRCLGPDYLLLRAAFWAARRRALGPPNTDRIFLNLGGADLPNYTLPLMAELAARFPAKQLAVVTGAAYPHQPALQAAAAAWPNVRLHHDLSAPCLAELLRRCGLFVCPPSGMAHECAAIGGLLCLFQTADNQQLTFDYLTGAGLALPYAALAALPAAALPTLAADLRARQRQAVDPAGIERRFQEVFADLDQAYRLEVRRATARDATLYFSWANEPGVRATAEQPGPISWDEHAAWFARRLADPGSYLFVFAVKGRLVGQVRVEFAGADGTVSYSVDAEHRGQKLGLALLRRALAELRRARPGAWALHGIIRADNAASLRIFERLGFEQTSRETRGETEFAWFRLEVPAVPTFV